MYSLHFSPTLQRDFLGEIGVPRKLTGSDGKTIIIPDGSRGLQGTDGHMVAIPPGGRGLMGTDGRMVAIPPGGEG
jgi:hypothetical protein